MFGNLRKAKMIMENFSGGYTDPKLMDFFFNKAVHTWFYDPPQYNYYMITAMSLGMAAAISVRHLFFNPDVQFRRQERRKNIVDRSRQHLYSLPYYNHHMRNWALRHIPSLVDNEPDYCAHHPIALRPDRVMSVARLPLVFSSPRYLVDDPSSKHCTHEAVEKRYQEMGYYPDRNAVEDEDD